MNTIEQRLHLLEQELHSSRRLNRWLVLAIVATTCIAAAPIQPPKKSKQTDPAAPQTLTNVTGNSERPRDDVRFRTLAADQIVLLDALGRSRARMMTTADGTEISLLDPEGKKRLELRQTATHSGLRLLDSSEQSVVALQISHDSNRAELELRDHNGRSVVTPAGIAVHDTADQARASLALINGNFPVLALNQRDHQGPPSIELAASERASQLKMHDAAGLPTVDLFATDDGTGSFTLRHPDGERLLQISPGAAGQEGPTIGFFGPAKPDGSGGLLPRLQLGLDAKRQPYLHRVEDTGRSQSAFQAD